MRSDGWTDGITRNQLPFEKRRLLWRFNTAGNNKTYFGLQVKCPIFLPDFKQNWIFSTAIPINPQYQISSGVRKCIVVILAMRASLAEWFLGVTHLC
jgi:hypothetical protein